MKRIIIILALLTVSMVAHAQQLDSLTRASMDTTLVGRDIMKIMSSGIQISQPPALRVALSGYVRGNSGKKITGYRIRVFYDNSPQARSRSEKVASSIRNQYPGVGVYRTFDSPNFKVAVGDFRTKDDALKVYVALKSSYPTALIIKETINYP